jgi:hypothetical protein
MSETGLVHYDAMRQAVAECARIDDAADIRDKAAALALYARQRDDDEMRAQVEEIRLRACIRIGQLSRELETAEANGRGPVSLPSSGKRKADALAEAGISTSTAQRYEQLAGGRDDQAFTVAYAAADSYFAQQRNGKAVPTMQGLEHAVKDAVTAALGEQPPRPKTEKPNFNPLFDDALAFIGALDRLISRSWEFEAMRKAAQPELIEEDCEIAVRARDLIDQYIKVWSRVDA